MRAEKNLQRFTIEIDSYTLWSWFEESMRTARRLPSIKPKEYKAQWVDIPKDWLAYGWDKAYIKIDGEGGKSVDLIAIDNLPSLLPRESSEEFAELMLPHLKVLNNRNNEQPWRSAKACFDEAVARMENS